LYNQEDEAERDFNEVSFPPGAILFMGFMNMAEALGGKPAGLADIA
jgi:hypothetical protein